MRTKRLSEHTNAALDALANRQDEVAIGHIEKILRDRRDAELAVVYLAGQVAKATPLDIPPGAVVSVTSSLPDDVDPYVESNHDLFGAFVAARHNRDSDGALALAARLDDPTLTSVLTHGFVVTAGIFDPHQEAP